MRKFIIILILILTSCSDSKNECECERIFYRRSTHIDIEQNRETVFINCDMNGIIEEVAIHPQTGLLEQYYLYQCR